MKILKRIALYVVLALAALSFIYPFLWMASATFKPLTEIGSLSLIPDHATLDNYKTSCYSERFGYHQR